MPRALNKHCDVSNDQSNNIHQWSVSVCLVVLMDIICQVTGMGLVRDDMCYGLCVISDDDMPMVGKTVRERLKRL